MPAIKQIITQDRSFGERSDARKWAGIEEQTIT